MSKRIILVYAGIGLMLLGCLYYFFREEPAAPIAPRTVSQPKQEVSFEKSALSEEKDGKRLWTINAESINVDNTSKKVYLTNVKGIFYRENGGTVELIARTGVADTASKEIFLEGDVTAVSSTDGATFTAPKARWSGEVRWFFAEGGVKLMREETVVTGDKLESDAAMEQIRVRGNAKVVRGGGN